MNLSSENILLLGSILLFLSILASKTSFRYGIPSLLIFMAVGMLAGSDGIGGIYFNDPGITQFLGVVALIFILFSGGMETKWESIKPVWKKGVTLSTLGVLITALTVGFFVSWLTDFSLVEGMLLGAIVSSTDAAAVFSILRTKSLGLKGGLRPLLELESGSNDPMAYFLTIAMVQLVKQPDTNLWMLVPMFFKQMVMGAAMGVALGYGMVQVINRIRLQVEGLYTVLLIALAFFSFAITDFIGGNGFLAVYIAAVILGNKNFVHKKTLIQYFDGLAWLMQIVMFITLGLLVYPTKVWPLAGTGFLIALFLMFVARPIAVYISMAFFHLRRNERIFISWVGLRGAVPIIFATYPLLANVEKADTIFHLVFFIAVSSVLLQGTTLAIFADTLGLTVPATKKRKFAIDLELSDQAKNVIDDIEIDVNSAVVGKEIMALGLPKTVLIVLIERDGKFITPNGSAKILAHDKLKLMADNELSLQAAFDLLSKT
jgi:cell volume regulation protein A